MELMVGITIGLLVVIAALGSLVFTQISSTVVGDSARLQQKADMVFRNIGYHISQAGAINLTTSVTPTGTSTTTITGKVVFSTAFTGYNPATTAAATGQIFDVHGVNGDGTAASTASDTLRVSYEDNGVTRDCLGNTPSNGRVDNQFSVVNGNLMCLGANATATVQPIAEGVEDFQVTYGVQTVLGGASQYRFFRADQILDWTNIQAVTICLQLAGDNQGNPQPGLIVTGCSGQIVPNDGLLRRVFRRTYSLRNALL